LSRELPALLGPENASNLVPDYPDASLATLMVDADGWRLTGKFGGLAAAASEPLTGWSNLPEMSQLTVRGPGWDSEGRFRVDRDRTWVLGGGVRRNWEKGVSEPKTVASTPYWLEANGTDLAFEVSSAGYVYRGEIVTLGAGPNWFAGARSVSERSVSNYSNLPYPKAMIDWLEPQREPVVGEFTLRLTAGFSVEGRNGRPLAAVKVTGTPWDLTSNSPAANGVPVTRLARYEWSGEVMQPGRGSAVWSANFSEADFGGPGAVLFSFEDCPWVGDSSAQRCVDTRRPLDPRITSFSKQGEATSVGRGIHSIMKWVGAVPQQQHVYIAAPSNSLGLSGSDATAVCQPDYAQARRQPFASFDAAWQALFDPARNGRSDASGAMVWLSDGSHLLPMTGSTGRNNSRRATDIAVTVQCDPILEDPRTSCRLVSTGSTRYVLFSSTIGSWTSFVNFRNVQIISTPQNIGNFASGGVRSTYFYFDNCHVQNNTGLSSPYITGGAIVCARSSLFTSDSGSKIFNFPSTSFICLYFHNCETNSVLNANVIWGLRSFPYMTDSPFLLGAASRLYIRDENLIAGYVYSRSWNPTVNKSFLEKHSASTLLVSEIGISVAYIKTDQTETNFTLAKLGEVIDQSYRNLLIEGVTTTRPTDATLGGGGLGLNMHNFPKTNPTSAPGNNYDRCVVRNSNLCRMAVKGAMFQAINVKRAETAKFFTGNRSIQHGVGMHGLIVGSRRDANMLLTIGLASIWGGQDEDYRLRYASTDLLEHNPVSGFLPLPPALLGHGFDLDGMPLFLDGTDCPGAFRRAVT
jgi:hypothetical protein